MEVENKMNDIKIGIIGGSGFYDMEFEDAEYVEIDTPFGNPSLAPTSITLIINKHRDTAIKNSKVNKTLFFLLCFPFLSDGVSSTVGAYPFIFILSP